MRHRRRYVCRTMAPGLNYFAYHAMTERFFYGEALTEHRISMAATQLFHYLRKNGAQNLPALNGLTLKEWFQGSKEPDKVTRARIVLRDHELTVYEMEAIEDFLPYGMYAGQSFKLYCEITKEAI